jgi:DNA-binding transcriptional LysR family regulator
MPTPPQANAQLDASPLVFKLRHMEVFRAVMLTGSISGAAKMLYVSQPAVSKLIAYVEGRLNLRLFDRLNNRLVPTADAHALYREVDRVYQAAMAVNECAAALAASPSQQLRICCSASLATAVLPAALAEVKREVPSMKILWHTSLIVEMPIQLLSKKVDLSIAALPVIHDHLHSRAFMRGYMVCVLPHGHPLADEPAISLHQLENEALMLFRPDMPFGKLLAEAIERAGAQLSSFLDFSNAVEAAALVKQGMGVTIIDEFVAAESGLVVKPLVEEIEFDISFVYSKFEPLPESARRLMAVLLEQAKRRGRHIEGVELPL